MSDSADAGGRCQVITKDFGAQITEGGTALLANGVNNTGWTLSHTGVVRMRRIKFAIPDNAGNTVESVNFILYDGHPATGVTLTPTGTAALQLLAQPPEGFSLGGKVISSNRLGVRAINGGGGDVLFATFEYDAE